MTYTPIKLITQTGMTLTESTDLSVATSTLLRKAVYLVLTKNSATYIIDVNKALTFTKGLDTSLPISQVFVTKLTDSFVTSYLASSIPSLSDNKAYKNSLRVFNPLAYKTYKVQFTSIDTPNIVDDSTRKGFLDDLVISGPEDLSHCLVSVNGVFHKTSMLNDKLYVHDGFRTIRLTGRQDVCVVDTSKLGGHQIVPLTSANVSLTTYNKYATITSSTSLLNKTVFLVIDGYWYHMDTPVFQYIDDFHLKVETTKLPLISQLRHNPRTVYTKDRYGEGSTQGSRKYSDSYSELFLNNRSVDTDTLTTRDFQYSRLTHYHSFMVVFDSPGIYPLVTELSPSGVSRLYTQAALHTNGGMLDYGVGLCPSYLLWVDVFKRKIVFISRQDEDTDIHLSTDNPAYIPTLITQPLESSYTKARFVDYIKA